MAIAVSDVYGAGRLSSYSTTLEVPAADNDRAVVIFCSDNTKPQTFTVTVNDNSATALYAINHNDGIDMQVFYILDAQLPEGAGTTTLVVTPNDQDNYFNTAVFAISVSGVDQTTPFASRTNSNNYSVSGVSNQAVIGADTGTLAVGHAHCRDADTGTLNFTAFGTQTDIGIADNVYYGCAGATYEAEASALSVTVTSATNQLRFETFSILPSAGGGGSAPTIVATGTHDQGDSGDQVNGQTISTVDTSTWFTGGATSYAMTTGPLPTGLSLDPDTGEITGTLGANASAGSPYTLGITATNGSGSSDEESFTWYVAAQVKFLAVDDTDLINLLDASQTTSATTSACVWTETTPDAVTEPIESFTGLSVDASGELTLILDPTLNTVAAGATVLVWLLDSAGYSVIRTMTTV